MVPAAFLAVGAFAAVDFAAVDFAALAVVADARVDGLVALVVPVAGGTAPVGATAFAEVLRDLVAGRGGLGAGAAAAGATARGERVPLAAGGRDARPPVPPTVARPAFDSPTVHLRLRAPVSARPGPQIFGGNGARV